MNEALLINFLSNLSRVCKIFNNWNINVMIIFSYI